MRVFPFFLLILTFASSATFFSGCAGHSVDENDPAAMYKDAEEEVKSDHYQLAIDKLKIIKNKFPYSKYSVDAQLKLADVYYLQESYAEAAAAYEVFRDLHPKHEKTPYAMFRIAKSHFNDAPSIVARDQTPAVKAQEAYTDFLKKYPTAAEADEAKKDLAKLRHDLASKELYIGNFYMRDEEYKSAEARFQKVLNNYSDTDVAAEAKKRLNVAQEKARKLEAEENHK